MKKIYILLFLLLGILVFPYEVVAKEWKVQCDYTVYYMNFGDDYYGLNIYAKIYDDDSVEIVNKHNNTVLKGSDYLELYDKTGELANYATMKPPSADKFISAAKKGSTYTCPKLYSMSDPTYGAFSVYVDSTGEVNDYYEANQYVASEPKITINEKVEEEIPVITISHECIRKIKGKLGNVETNLDFYFRMYTDGSKELCVAASDTTSLSCSKTLNVFFGSINAQMYNISIDETQESKIFQQSFYDVNHNLFSCPEQIYISQYSQTGAFMGQTNYFLTTEKAETEKLPTGTLTGDGTQPEPEKPDFGDNLYGCEVIPASIRDWIESTLNLVKYIALVIVIVLGILDFLKAAGSGEAETMKKAGTDFLKRIIAVVILFLLPLVVNLILNLIEIYGADSTCI